MAYLFTNNATTTLASSITAAATTIPVASGTGSLFPAPLAPDIFHATLTDVSGNSEIVRVTARATDILTVVRGQEGTAPRNFSAGDRLELRLTAAALNSIAQVDSQEFTGNIRVPTAPTNDASKRAANTELVDSKIVAALAEADVPSKSGVGATGEWDIDIKGTAAKCLPLGGGLMVGNTRAQVVDLASASLIDVGLGPAFRRTVTSDVTFSVTAVPAAGQFVALILDLTNAGAFNIGFWPTVKWQAGAAPNLASAGRHVVGFYTVDGGSSWIGVLLGRDFK